MERKWQKVAKLLNYSTTYELLVCCWGNLFVHNKVHINLFASYSSIILN